MFDTIKNNIAIMEPIVSINGDKNEIIADSVCLSFLVSAIIRITLEITIANIPMTNVKYPNTCAPKSILGGESVNINRKWIRNNDALPVIKMSAIVPFFDLLSFMYKSNIFFDHI